MPNKIIKKTLDDEINKGITIDQLPIDYSEEYHQQYFGVADFETTTCFETDNPDLNQIKAINDPELSQRSDIKAIVDSGDQDKINSIKLTHTYSKSKNQSVNVWLWTFSPCVYDISKDENDQLKFNVRHANDNQKIKYDIDSSTGGFKLYSDQSFDELNEQEQTPIYYGYTIESFMSFIKTYCSCYTIAFHNGDNFDSNFIWDYALNHGFKFIPNNSSFGGYLDTISGNHSKYTVRFSNKATVNFCDSFKLWKMSIAQMGVILTSANQNNDSEIKGITPLIENDWYVARSTDWEHYCRSEWIEYCARDTQILHDFITSKLTFNTSNDPDIKENSIDVDFDFFTKMSISQSTIASLAYHTAMNYGYSDEMHLNPWFKPFATIRIGAMPKKSNRIKTFVQPRKGLIVDHYKEIQNTEKARIFTTLNDDQRLATFIQLMMIKPTKDEIQMKNGEKIAVRNGVEYHFIEGKDNNIAYDLESLKHNINSDVDNLTKQLTTLAIDNQLTVKHQYKVDLDNAQFKDNQISSIGDTANIDYYLNMPTPWLDITKGYQLVYDENQNPTAYYHTEEITYSTYDPVYRKATKDEIEHWYQHLANANEYEYQVAYYRDLQKKSHGRDILVADWDNYRNQTKQERKAKRNTIAPAKLPKSKSSNGSYSQLDEMREYVKNEKLDAYKEEQLEYINRKADRKAIIDANNIAKRAYKGGISMVGPYWMNKYIDIDTLQSMQFGNSKMDKRRQTLVQNIIKDYPQTGIIGLEFDVNSLYPSVYGNIMYNDYKTGSDYALPSHQIHRVLTGKDLTSRKIKRAISDNTKHPAFVRLSNIMMKVKIDRLPALKTRTEDQANSQPLRISGTDMTYDPRAHYMPILNLHNVILTMPEFEYLINNYEPLIPQSEDWPFKPYSIDSIIEFERDEELEQKLYQHAHRWSAIKRYAKYMTEHQDKAWQGLVNYAKLMLNSPYGKLGNYDKQYPMQIFTNDGIKTVGHFSGGNQMADVPAAAYITAYGRMKLANTINQAGIERFVYCDTDSMYILGSSIPKEIEQWVDDTKIGYWAEEKKFKAIKAIKSKCYGADILTSPNNFKWKSTAAGFDTTIPKKDFKVGIQHKISRSKAFNGGKLIYKTYQSIQPINNAYAQILNDFYNATTSII